MSDRQGRKPTTTVVRHPADWFADYLYSGGFAVLNSPPAGMLNFLAMALYNGDESGRVMKVYGAFVTTDGGEGVGIYFQKGAVGALVGPAVSIRPDRGSPNVNVYQQTQTLPLASLNPFNFGQQYGLIPTDGYDGGKLLSPFQLWIVPVGYSIVMTNIQGSTVPSFFMHFQMAAQ